MEFEGELRRALNKIPDVLIGADDCAIRDDAVIALGILKRLGGDRRSVVFVGPSGAGRSWLFNAFVGLDVSEEGAIRPTTSDLVAATRQGSPLDGFDGVVYKVPGLPESLVAIDTPAWEHDAPAVVPFLRSADVVVVVVSPTRYADASVAALWKEVSTSRVLVLNRVDSGAAQSDELERSVAAIFGRDPVIIHTGQSDGQTLEAPIADALSVDRYVAERAILTHLLQSSARYLARASASAASAIAVVGEAVDREGTSDVPAVVFTVADSWLATKQAMVAEVAKQVGDSDARIVSDAGIPLGERLLVDIGPWSNNVVEGDLDVWRDRSRELFLAHASIRWRRGPAEQLIDHYSWKTAINPNVVAPHRFRRIMGKNLEAVTSTAHEELLGILSGSVDERRRRWEDSLDLLGSYQPGQLLTIADSLPAGDRHG